MISLKSAFRLHATAAQTYWQLPDFDTLKSCSFPTFDSINPNSADVIFRHLNFRDDPKLLSDNASLKTHLEIAIEYYSQLQVEDGFVPGDYGGPLFLLPGLIIASYVTQSPLPEAYQYLMVRYMLNHQNPDGGWGMHIEGRSTMFGTTLQYVALRLLGFEPEMPDMQKARAWIHHNGGATNIPSWGKFYLSLLGVYDWSGCHSLLPELWLFPKWLPVHPSRYWCHTRMVYLPMAYAYGHRITAAVSPIIHQLREELYLVPYESINWTKARNACAPTDNFSPTSPLLRLVNFLSNGYEKFHLLNYRKKALDYILEMIHAEDEQTNYINLGPVNQVINSMCIYHAYGKESTPFKKHYKRWFDYLWLAEDGMKMNGYNGSQLWDTAFALQAIQESGLSDKFSMFTERAYHFIDQSQIRHDVLNGTKYFRHSTKGGWPFSTAENGWPVSDCTAEGLKVMLTDPQKRMSNERFQMSVDLLLSMQNKDGGWASYELTRGPKYLELLNPSGVFGNIMIEYSYTECTSAVIQGLVKFVECFSNYRNAEINAAVLRGIRFLQAQQRDDGSWYGSWAVCFTYGTWFGVEGLLAAGFNRFDSINGPSPEIKSACAFLASKQNADGGWGESFESCIEKRYVPHHESQVVNTSWALLTLMAAHYPNHEVINRGVQYLLSVQKPDGDFPQQGISGVFNHNCGITYASYRNIFPIWAIGRYRRIYG